MSETLSPDAPFPDLEEHGRFVRALAWRLLHDEDAAEEVVQETMLAAVRSPPSRDRSVRPWLATVARNVIRKRFRGRARRRRREEKAARPEALPSAAALAERAETLRRVVDAVLLLEEPNRSAVLLRYYEDLPPREIAARLGVPVETVRGRIKRAVRSMRRTLDARSPGGRRGWAVPLAGLCGYDARAALVTGGAGATSGAAAAAPAASAVVVLALLAGIVAGGVAAWRIRAGGVAPGEHGPRSARASVPAAAPAPAASSRSRTPSATSETFASLRAEHDRLEARRTELERALALLRPPVEERAFFRMGLPSRTPVFDASDWETLAKHVLAMQSLAVDLRAEVVAGGSPSVSVIAGMRENNLPLALFAVRVAPELGTTGPNEAYTHPAVLANLIRAALALSNAPLSPRQEAQIRALGQAAAADESRGLAAMPPGAPILLGRAVALEARLRFTDAVKDVLEPHQRLLLYPSETEDRLKVDLLSPALASAQRLSVEAADRDTLEARLLASLLGAAGLDDRDPSRHAWIAARWLERLPHALEPAPADAEDVVFPPAREVCLELRAEAEAIQDLVATGGLPPEARERLRQVATLSSPRLVCARCVPAGDPTSEGRGMQRGGGTSPPETPGERR